MVLYKGEKIHVITRRLFDSDLRRHFVGEISELSDTAVRAAGYVFVLIQGFHSMCGVKKNESALSVLQILATSLM